MPRVSLITPLFNKGRYVAATVRSVLAQTFADWEMIIVDNGSTDEGPEIVRGFSDERIRYISISARGPSVARNRGIQLARGEWVHFLDGDDLIEPEYLAEQIQAGNENPQADIIVSSWQDFPDGDQSTRTLRRPTGLGHIDSSRVLLDSSIAFTPWAPNAAMVRARALSAAQLWPEDLDRFLAEDTTFWFRLVNELRVAYSDSVGALYRTQALDCRTRIADSSKWFEGNHAAVSANIEFLSNTGRLLTDGQCESLMRFYSGLYMNARLNGNRVVAALALSHAKHWLTERCSRGTPTTLTVRLRRLLGLSIYAQVLRCANMVLRAAHL